MTGNTTRVVTFGAMERARQEGVTSSKKKHLGISSSFSEEDVRHQVELMSGGTRGNRKERMYL